MEIEVLGEKSCGEKRTTRRLGADHTADRKTVVPVVVVGRVKIAIVEVQVVSVGSIVDRTRPIVAVAA